MGVIYLWTAIEMTAWFVAAGSLVVIVEFLLQDGPCRLFGAALTLHLPPVESL